jgi:hypothetical protein
LQHRPALRTDFAAVVAQVQKHGYVTVKKNDLRKIEAGAILFLDLTKTRHTVDLCFVEAAWTHYKKGTDITVHLTVVTQKNRPLLELRLDPDTVVAVFTPLSQDRYTIPPTQYAHLIGRTGIIDWPRPARCPMKFVDEMAIYKDAGKIKDKVAIRRVFRNFLNGAEDVNNPLVIAEFVNSSSSGGFVVDGRVQVRFNDEGGGVQEWFHGTITELVSIDNGKHRCEILYDDGSAESAVLPDNDVELEHPCSVFRLSDLSHLSE